MKRSRFRFISSIVMICMLFSSFGTAFATTVTTASDIEGHWAESLIGKWVSSGWIEGYEDGSFKPDDAITRAEMMTLINRTFNFTEKAEISFTDLPTTSWAHEEIAKAIKAGYITGYTDNTIGADKQISRQEAAVIIDRLLKFAELEISETTFSDEQDIASWAKTAIEAAVSNNIMNGYAADNTFKPEQSMTRAEAVVTLDRAILANSVVYNNAGTFGPVDGIETVDKNVIINTAGVILQNMVINGDLTFAAGIGEGEAFLNNVTVNGETFVRGGGENSIHLNNSVLLTITIDKRTGTVRVVAEGSTTVVHVKVNSTVILQETELVGTGFSDVTLTDLLPEGAKVTLKGSFDNLEVVGSQIIVDIPEGSVEQFIANATSTGLTLELGEDATIVSLILDAVAKVLGNGTIESATLSEEAQAGSSFETPPTNIIEEGKEVTTPSPSQGGSGGSGGTGGTTTQYGSVTGYVYDHNQAPLTGVSVLIYSGTFPNGKLVTTIQTDVYGKYTSESNIPAGPAYFHFEKSGYLPNDYIIGSFRILANRMLTIASPMELDISSVFGLVRAGGVGVEGMTVIVTDSGSTDFIGLTDDGGYFRFPNLPEGSYTVTVDTSGTDYLPVTPETINVVNGQHNFAGPYDLLLVVDDEEEGDEEEEIEGKLFSFSSNPPGAVAKFEYQIEGELERIVVTDSVRLPSSDQKRVILHVTPESGKSLLNSQVTGIGSYGIGYAGERERTTDEFSFSTADVNTDNPSIVFNYVNSPDMDNTTITLNSGDAGSKSIEVVIIAKDSDGDPINGITASQISLTLQDDDDNDVWLPLGNYTNSPTYNIYGVKISNMDTMNTDNIFSFTITFTADDLTEGASDRFTNLKDDDSVDIEVSVLRVIRSMQGILPE